MAQTSVRWEITPEGEDYLERTQSRLAQMRYRLLILEYLKEHGSTLERDLPPFQHLDYMREHGWTGRARIQEESARKALVWLRDREYIGAVGGG